MYDAVVDPYCYPDTTVLINKLGLRDQAKLDAFEAEITTQRAAEPFPAGRLSYAHYRAMHRHLFQDVYKWAGRLRTVRISKEGSMFCYPEHIDGEMRKLFGALRDNRYFQGLRPHEFARRAAHFLSELNAIHPFREGNGRTQLALLTLLAERAGHPLALNNLEPPALLAAMVTSFSGKETKLRKLIEMLMRG
ncbi:Fic/DOC family protein [Bradyrhizobium sp.]